jgi:hypothetical protein
MFALLCAGLLLLSLPLGESVQRDLASFIGLQHIAPCYTISNDIPCLHDGAEQAHRLGSRVFKMTLSEDTPQKYPFNNAKMPWPNVTSLRELADSSQIKTLFSNQVGTGTNFSAFVLWAYSFGQENGGYWCKSFTEEDAARERKEFAQLTQYLLETYRGMGRWHAHI